uniref:R-spondin 3 n=1 Tax=Myripristis murdjan TaxID=586833 RepID=A0A668A6M1_9TELE
MQHRLLLFLKKSVKREPCAEQLLALAFKNGTKYGQLSRCQQGGCLTCSDYNGCLSCKPRFFMHLERIGMKQIGVCMTSCPPGFYGTRSPDRNTCTKCRPECDSCFNKNFCTRCRAGYYLHLGKCQESCPEGLVRSDTQRECVGEWSEWSPCSRSGRTCGFKRGQETRTRQVLQYPSPFGKPCPEISEIKECLVKRRRCPGKYSKNNEEEREKKSFNSAMVTYGNMACLNCL